MTNEGLQVKQPPESQAAQRNWYNWYDYDAITIKKIHKFLIKLSSLSTITINKTVVKLRENRFPYSTIASSVLLFKWNLTWLNFKLV